MLRKWFAVWFFPVLSAMLISGCSTPQVEVLEDLPYLPGNEYALYCFNDVLPHPVSGRAPETLDGAKKQIVFLAHETIKIPGFFRQSRSRSAVLVSEFESPAKGTMVFGCDADRFLKVECNGKIVLDRWQTPSASSSMSKYNNILTVPVRKGHNVLVFTVANGSTGWRFTAGSIPLNTLPTAENLRRLNGILPSPSSHAHQTDARLMDQAIRETKQEKFRTFAAAPVLTDENLKLAYDQNPLLKIYDVSLDRVLKELSSETVAPGEIVVWNLGTSGMVVKTDASIFGIDIVARRAELLAPQLDALFLSGSEYQCNPLLDAMILAKKPVYSSFFHNGKILKSPDSFRVKNLSVNSVNAPALNPKSGIATIYRISCGKGADAPILLYAGKVARADLLRSTTLTDLFVISAAAENRIPVAVRTVSPGLTVISGLWELTSDSNRLYYSTDTDPICARLRQDDFRSATLLWGEKIRLSSKALRRKSRSAMAFRYENALNAPFALTGFPWCKPGKLLSRLPFSLTEKEVSSKVLELARQTAGGVIRFRTDSPEIALRVQCGEGKNCSLDLYEEISPGVDRLCGTIRSNSSAEDGAFLQKVLFRDTTKKLRSFAIYLPNACAIHQLEVGLKEKAQLLPPLPQTVKKPIVFFGGTVTQGVSASHPAHSFSSILCRALHAPQVNLGFDRIPQTAPAIAQLIGGLDPAALVLEFDGTCAPAEQENFFKTIRELRPDLPILLLGDCCHFNQENAAALRRIYENALGRGDRHVRLIEGKDLFAPYTPEDCCVDSYSPSDLGFRLMARRILPVLRLTFFSR